MKVLNKKGYFELHDIQHEGTREIFSFPSIPDDSRADLGVAFAFDRKRNVNSNSKKGFPGRQQSSTIPFSSKLECILNAIIKHLKTIPWEGKKRKRKDML